MNNYPRLIDPAMAFNAIVEWFENTVIDNYRCPGIIVGLSGTDSLVAFLAAYQAFEKVDKGDRVMGIHFAPSEDFLYDHPEAESHLWFSREVLPWLAAQASKSIIKVDTSIDWRCDGLRWGMLAEIASTDLQDARRTMRQSEDKYWVCGTRNKSEDILFNYSNASLLASLQPIIDLWKSEILLLSDHLGIPEIATKKSCEVDCICGRDWLRANHPKELDWILMSHQGLLNKKFIEDHMSIGLLNQLTTYANSRISQASFKQHIPYTANLVFMSDSLVQQFENGRLNLKEFNHEKHLYIAWYYLKHLSFQESLERYSYCLNTILNNANLGHKFSQEITNHYFDRLNSIMLQQTNIPFEEVVEKITRK